MQPRVSWKEFRELNGAYFYRKGVCIYRKVCNQILKCPCTVCNAGSDIYMHAHTMTVLCMINGVISFSRIKHVVR